VGYCAVPGRREQEEDFLRSIRLLPLLLAVIGLVCLPSVGNATLIVNGPVTDTALMFDANLTWTAGGVDSPFVNIGNWIVVLSASQGVLLQAVVVHNVAPHPGELAPNPNVLVGSIPGAAPGGNGMASVTVNHPVGPHADSLNVVLTSTGPNSSDIDITAVHAIPEPATWWLAAIGAGFVFIGRKPLGRR
jgi:hypothetical protein